MVESNDRSPSWSTSTSDRVITLSFGRSIFAMKTNKNGLAAIRPMIMATNRNLRQWRRMKLGRAFVVTGQELRLTRIRLQPALYLCLHRGSLPENTAGRQPRFRGKTQALQNSVKNLMSYKSRFQPDRIVRRRTRRHYCGLASRIAPERRGRVK